MNLPETVFIVTGHHYEYSGKVIKAFYLKSSAFAFYDLVEGTKEYDYYTGNEYEVEPFEMDELPKKVYVLVFQKYLSDPDIWGVYYSKEQVIEAYESKRHRDFRWIELELE